MIQKAKLYLIKFAYSVLMVFGYPIFFTRLSPTMHQ